MKRTVSSRRASAGRPSAKPKSVPVPRPKFRRLRSYAFDPSLSVQLETSLVNLVTLQVPWEYDPATGEDTLQPGPIGDYVEVIDFDPASDCFYLPVDLNQPYLLAQDGLAPSEGNPQFHQQMVYAVAMTTIRNFELALGRTAFWAPRWERQDGKAGERFVKRLRIYPHALREANAYYSPEKKALLFGYFPASAADPESQPSGGIVFTCLSHDIIAHETTHALLDGLHPRYNEPTNPDVLAFHEAFADIIALFQHFSFPEVLRHQVARTRGNLATENLLAQLAQQFGKASGMHRALRDALGSPNPQGTWEPAKPDPTSLERVFEPHDRGAILVGAVFDAFATIYRTRSADLLRIATNGSGLLPEGQLHPDLVKRLALEAAKSARHVLHMCIRALDYCPPVDLTFGEYLRALITADYDLVPDDDKGYRIAFVEAFRRRGIHPPDVRTISVESLRWSPPNDDEFENHFRPMVEEAGKMVQGWDLSTRSEEIFEGLKAKRARLHDWLVENTGRGSQALMGLDLSRPGARFEVHSLRPARRVSPDGESLADLILEVTQHRNGYFDPAVQAAVDSGKIKHPPKRDFAFRGGFTMIIDLETSRVRYCISKRVTNDQRLDRQRRFLKGDTDTSLRALYFGRMAKADGGEPFAMLHRGENSED